MLPQHPHDLLQSAVALQGDELVVRHLRDVKAALATHKLSTGELVQVRALPLVLLGARGGCSRNQLLVSRRLQQHMQSLNKLSGVYMLLARTDL